MTKNVPLWNFTTSMIENSFFAYTDESKNSKRASDA
jgi:hypothetical protein